MPRPSNTQITAQLAKKIVDKLKGQVSGQCKAHVYYDVFSLDGETYLTQLSLRHGSRLNLGHDHMIKQLDMNAYKAKRLGQCTISREQWLKEFQDE